METVHSEIKKWGNGYGIRLTKGLLTSANISSREAITIVAEEGKITILKRHQKPLLQQLAEFNGYYRPEKGMGKVG